MGRILAVLWALAAVLAACVAPPPAAAKSLDCGPATALVGHPNSPQLTGAPIGPLLIRGYFPEGATTAVVFGFERGRPTKMLALVAQDMDSDVALTGLRCSDGQPLRFWLNKDGGGIWSFGPSSTPVPDDMMASTGDLRAVLPKLAVASGTSGYGGYILFPSAGAYRIASFAGERKIGQVTLVVTPEQPAARPVPSRDLYLPYAKGERELIAALEQNGIRVREVTSSTSEALLDHLAEARILRVDDGALDVLFFADVATAAAIRICPQPSPPGRYLYQLAGSGRSQLIDSAVPRAFLLSGNAVLFTDVTALVGRVGKALGIGEVPC